MSLDNILLIPGVGGLNLQRVLFGAGEVGGIWDWSDRSTMFQDVAGTQPITASGQTRALHLDKSKGLVLGSDVVVNGGFDTDTVWVKGTGWTISGGTANNVGPSGQNIAQLGILVTGRFYRVTVDVASVVGNYNVRMGTALSLNPHRSPDLVAGINDFIIPADGPDLNIRNNLGTSIAINSISVRELPGNHRYQASAASRPQYIEDETGHYGLYDGVDDFDETNAVDFTGTDKMTVWWGGRKLSDAANSIILELSASSSVNNGSFGMETISTGGYQYRNTGTTARLATVATGFSSPVSNVLCGIGDISGDISRLRINGVQVAQNTGDQGTGNYGNHKLYFGRRAGTLFPANIREYMTIIRGAQTSTLLIEQVERAVRGKIKGLTW